MKLKSNMINSNTYEQEEKNISENVHHKLEETFEKV